MSYNWSENNFCKRNTLKRNIKKKYKNQQKTLLRNAQIAAERDVRLSKALKDVPRDKNGRINFTEAVKAMGIKLDFNGKK